MKKKSMDSDVRFRKLIENNYSGITLIDANLKIIYRSPSAERITGWTTEKRALKPSMAIVHPDDQPAVIIVLDKVLTVPGLSLTYTFRSMHYSGSFIWLENTYTNMLDEPDINAIVCNFRDVTEQRETELELKKQTEQVSELLETMTDSFISLDKDLCYTYVNKQVTKLLGRTAESLIGQHIWTLFPDAVGSVTYKAIQTALIEKKHVCNEDFYAPLQLWQENRVYPSADGVSVFIRDITKQKKEQHHLKLLESVITNTTDAILITEAEPFDEPGPRVLYVNEAFTRMTGYRAEEIIGQSPRILQGPKTDTRELKRLGASLRRWKPCEITVLNYKKNGEEFWINFTVNPVADEKGWFTHWISIDRDVTNRKNEELKKLLLADVSQLFNSNHTLIGILDEVCQHLIDSEDFLLASIYLVATDQRKIKLTSHCFKPGFPETFSSENFEAKRLKPGEGLPGLAWETKSIQRLDNIGHESLPGKKQADESEFAGSIYGVPLFDNKEVIGVLVLAIQANRYPKDTLPKLFDYIGDHLGTEIVRKQQEKELNQIFNFSPDVICIAGTDGYFKKVNPALCNLLEYTENELLVKPMIAFIHPDDQEKMGAEFNDLGESRVVFNFETRTVSKSGKVIWLIWTSAPASEEGLLFCTAKDITNQKLTHNLLEESERKYSDLFQLSPLAKWVFDVETLRFLDVNEAAIAHYGYTRQEFLNMTIKDIRPPEEMPLLLNILASHQSHQQFSIQGIVTHQKKNGEKLLIEIQSSDIVYKSRKARLIIAHDITDRINYIKAIEKQNETLKEISWMQSHVIRAPLSRIMGLIPLLDEISPNPAEFKQIIEYIKISAIELDDVIRNITDKTSAVDYKI